MRIKSYFANTVEDAMDQARVELGVDAMLMNSRRTAPEAKHLGAYEVVFATEGDSASPRTRGGREASAPSSADVLVNQIAELRRQVEGVKQSVTRQTAHARWSRGASPESAELYASLMHAGFSGDMAQELIGAAESRLDRLHLNNEQITSVLERELSDRVTVSATLGREGQERRIVMLVGAPGTGKTATLTKLAIRYGIQASQPIHLISADSYRVGSSEQLRSYAGILGAPFTLLDSVPALAQTLDRTNRNGLVLIDTPGFGAGDSDLSKELAEFCAERSDIDVQLVLPAHAHGTVLTRIVDRFSAFNPSRLITTFLDEAEVFGGVLEQALRTNLPLSFMTYGQQIPDDLKPADASRLIGLVAEDWQPQRAVTAA